MAVYKVVLMGDPVLREKAKPVKAINDSILRLLDNLRDTLHEYEGVGLAAPQIGVSKRVIVVDNGEEYYELINPEIIREEGLDTAIEGCLSIPQLTGKVKRAARVTVKGLNREGEELSIEADGLLARAFQHEIDHLDGVLFVDRAEWVARKEI
ncbi:MAG: peptide deformylase [Syntrophomonadaceae bacterium]|jgi:peptide deformylase|nr:peptide deformylase [Syntrophomonadaceae bacterium]